MEEKKKKPFILSKNVLCLWTSCSSGKSYNFCVSIPVRWMFHAGGKTKKKILQLVLIFTRINRMLGDIKLKSRLGDLN